MPIFFKLSGQSRLYHITSKSWIHYSWLTSLYICLKRFTNEVEWTTKAEIRQAGFPVSRPGRQSYTPTLSQIHLMESVRFGKQSYIPTWPQVHLIESVSRSGRQSYSPTWPQFHLMESVSRTFRQSYTPNLPQVHLIEYVSRPCRQNYTPTLPQILLMEPSMVLHSLQRGP